MRATTRATPLLLTVAGLAALGSLWWGRIDRVAAPAAVATAVPESRLGEEAAAYGNDTHGRGQADGAVPDAEVLEHPRVKAYLQREADRQALQAYFDNPGDDPAQARAIWELIESLEAQHRVIGFEALHLKMAWLSVNSPDEATFRERAETLLSRYRDEAKRRSAAYDPRDIPGFERYKRMERDIIAEVSAMNSFPDGHSKQSYLRARLQQARVEAYAAGER